MNVLPDRYRILIISLLLVIPPAIVFWGTTVNGFVWDDRPLYINEKNFPKEHPFSEFGSFWVPRQNEMYIPATKILWAAQVSMATAQNIETGKIEYQAKYFHFFNLLFHIINGILVFLIFRKLTGNDWASLVGALLFSLHPLQAESVAWISEFRGILSAFFGFTAILSYMKFRTEEETKYNYIAAGLYLLSMLSKPTGIAFILIVLILDKLEYKQKWKSTFKSLYIWLIPVIPIILITLLSESGPTIQFKTPLWARPLIYLDSNAWYLFKVIYPSGLAASYGRTPEFIMSGNFYYFSGLITAVLIAYFRIIRKSYNLLGGFLIFTLGYITVSGLVPFYYQYWSVTADRYIYISMFGFGLMAAVFIGKAENYKVTLPIAAVILAVLGFLSFNTIPTWKNDKTLWTDVIKKYPDRSPHPYYARGSYYIDHSMPEKALQDFNTVVKMDRSFPGGYLNAGNAYFDMERFQSAIRDYTRSLEYDKYSRATAYINRAKAYLAAGNSEKSIKDFTEALKYDPENPGHIYSDRGIAYAKLGMLDKAIRDFSKALEFYPHDRDAYENLQYAQKLKGLQNRHKDTTEN